MKKFIFALVLTLIVPTAAFAAPKGWKDAAQCVVPPDHAVWNSDNTKIIGCITDDAWQAAMQEAASRNNMHLPVIAPGASVTDEEGVVYAHVCPFFATSGCYDLTHTDAYRNSMRQSARELIAAGYTAKTAPIMAGWINSVR